MARSSRSGRWSMSARRWRSGRNGHQGVHARLRMEKLMAYWLLKTEPDAYSWDDQVKKGAKGDAWTGVRNFRARGHLAAMKKGDLAFFYHTGDEKQIVGIVE